MKKNLLSKNIHQWLLLLVCFVGTLPTWAEDYTEDGIIYDLDRSAKTAIVKGHEDYRATSAEIKSNVAGCEVTSIGGGAFSDCDYLTSINIPSSVTSIGIEAFSYCSSLTSINIPSSVTSIEERAFYGCCSLTSINIPSSVTSIERSTFSYCSSLTSINIPSSVISIGEGAFSGCSSLTSINIPSSVTSIGEEAFLGCSALTAFTVDTNNPNYSAEGCVLFNKEKTTLICVSGSQKTYNIPSSVTRIGQCAFYKCSALTSINIPSSVTCIEPAAFQACSSLTSINIPSSLTFIDFYTFMDCSSLTSINIPSSVTSISMGAFANCSSLTSINIPSSVTFIGGTSVFEGCSALTAFTVDANNPNYSAEGCMLFNKEKTKLIKAVGNQKTYNIPSSVTSIGSSAFSGCNALTSINIPSSVTSIEERAFEGCDALKVVLIQSDRIEFGCSVFGTTNIYAFDDSVRIDLTSDFDNDNQDVNNNIGGRWYTYTTPNIYDYNGYAISNKWSGNDLEYNTAQYLRTISQTSTNAQTLISNHKAIYNNLSEDLRKDLEDNLQKIDDLASIITEGDAALSALNTNLSKAYKNVCKALYEQLGLSDLYKLYTQAEDFTSSLDNATPDYSPLLSTYTIGSNILTSADQLSTNKQETQEGKISNLVDGNKNTFFHSTWSANNPDNVYAYLQVDLKDAYQNLLLNYTKRYNFTGNKGYPTLMHVFGTNTPNDENSWTDCGNVKLYYNEDNNQSGKALVKLGGDYQYIRLQVEKTGGMDKTNGNLYFALGELNICPITAMKDAPYTEKDGLITDASQLSSNYVEPQEGSLAGLIDNNLDTYFHSSWSQSNSTEAYHYLQVDLKDAYKQIALKYTKRQNLSTDNGTPVTLHVYVTNTPDDENSWTDLGTKTCTYDYDFGGTGLLPLDFGGEAYRHIRLIVKATSQNAKLNGNLYFYWSELHAYTRASKADVISADTYAALTEALTKAKEELDAELATEDTYKALKAAYETATTETSDSMVDFAKSFYLTAYSDKALVVPTGVKAAVVTANGEGIRNDYRYNSGDVIPAETGVLLKGGKGNSFYLSASESTEMAPEDNLLHGTLNDEMTNVAGADKYYKLSYDRATGTEIGFYWGAANGGAFMNKGGKAFLAIPATLQAAQLTGFSLFDLDSNQAITGIEHATATPAVTLRVYDLNGRRINVNHVDELPQGIYVINGKKVIR